MDKHPELVAPAGSLSKLKIAVAYGADALYLAGDSFGLRAAADNFTEQELLLGISFAHEHNVKCYVTLNGFLHDNEISELPPFLERLVAANADGVIVSDLGVLKTVQKYSKLPIHISTQASSLNEYSAMLWKEFGAKRVVVGREVSIPEAALIQKKSGLEVEMFIHGAMCISYSGHCTISNYTQGRDSNRGGCAQSCRFEYTLESNGESATDYFMSSKDLCGTSHVESAITHRITALKIEGRMKGPLYLATSTAIYRALLDGKKVDTTPLDELPHREYTDGNLVSKASGESIYHKRLHEESLFDFGGVVLSLSNQFIFIQVASPFCKGDTLKMVGFDGQIFPVICEELLSVVGTPIEKSKPGSVVKIPLADGVKPQMVFSVRSRR